MKLEVGMYVRYISGFHHNESDKPIVLIGKLLRVDDYINLDTFFGGGVYPTKEFEKFIKGEPSYDIIDLVQVGDYVDGEQVQYIENDECEKRLIAGDSCERTFWNHSIESIVTKEQFEAMKYEIK